MMKYIVICVPLFSLLLGGCDNADNQVREVAKQQTPSQTPSAHTPENLPQTLIQEAVKQQTQPAFITEKSVWQGNLDKCRNSESVDLCFIDEIKNTGTEEALKAAQYLTEKEEMSYVSAYTKEGPVGIANIEYPFRANTTAEILLIPSEGPPIDIDDITDDLLKTFPAWQDFEKQHPDAAPWPPGTLNKKEQTTSDGLDFIVSYPIQTCHACDRLASLYISYKFAPDGKFIGRNLLDIK